jgi:hypothetical protein
LKHTINLANCGLTSDQVELIRPITHNLNLEDNEFTTCRGIKVKKNIKLGGNPLNDCELNCDGVSLNKRNVVNFFFDPEYR